MFKKLLLTASAAAMVATPVVAHAAPARASTPVAAEAESLGGSALIPVLVFAVAVALMAVVFSDGDDEPVSP